MVKVVLALLASFVAASDLDHTQMLQKTTRKSVSRHSSMNDPNAWDAAIDTSVCEGFITKRCPISVMDDIETGFNDDKDLLEGEIDELSGSIEETETQIEKINNKTEKIVNATLKAIDQASRAEIAIGKVKVRLAEMTKSFDEKMDELQASEDEVQERVDRVKRNSECLTEFTHPSGDETNENDATTATTTAAATAGADLIQKQSSQGGFWWWVRTTVKKVVDKATSDVLLANDQIWLFKIKDSQATMKAEIAELEETADNLAVELQNEVRALAEAMALKEDEADAKAIAIENRDKIRASLNSLKAEKQKMKEDTKLAIDIQRSKVKVLNAWLDAFKLKFGNSLFKQMSNQEFC